MNFLRLTSNFGFEYHPVSILRLCELIRNLASAIMYIMQSFISDKFLA